MSRPPAKAPSREAQRRAALVIIVALALVASTAGVLFSVAGRADDAERHARLRGYAQEVRVCLVQADVREPDEAARRFRRRLLSASTQADGRGSPESTNPANECRAVLSALDAALVVRGAADPESQLAHAVRPLAEQSGSTDADAVRTLVAAMNAMDVGADPDARTPEETPPTFVELHGGRELALGHWEQASDARAGAIALTFRSGSRHTVCRIDAALSELHCAETAAALTPPDEWLPIDAPGSALAVARMTGAAPGLYLLSNGRPPALELPGDVRSFAFRDARIAALVAVDRRSDLVSRVLGDATRSAAWPGPGRSFFHATLVDDATVSWFTVSDRGEVDWWIGQQPPDIGHPGQRLASLGAVAANALEITECNTRDEPVLIARARTSDSIATRMLLAFEGAAGWQPAVAAQPPFDMAGSVRDCARDRLSLLASRGTDRGQLQEWSCTPVGCEMRDGGVGLPADSSPVFGGGLDRVAVAWRDAVFGTVRIRVGELGALVNADDVILADANGASRVWSPRWLGVRSSAVVVLLATDDPSDGVAIVRVDEHNRVRRLTPRDETRHWF